MNKLEFDKLSITEQINYVNEELKTYTRTDIYKSIGIPRTTMSDRTKREGYSFNAETRQYYKDNTLVIQLHSSNVKVAIKPRREPTNVYQSELIELAENKDALMEMLKNYQRDKEIIIEVPQLNIETLPKDYKDNIVNKSIKIYDKIYELFNEVCDSYSSNKKQDLISLALWEFIERYKH